MWTFVLCERQATGPILPCPIHPVHLPAKGLAPSTTSEDVRLFNTKFGVAPPVLGTARCGPKPVAHTGVARCGWGQRCGPLCRGGRGGRHRKQSAVSPAALGTVSPGAGGRGAGDGPSRGVVLGGSVRSRKGEGEEPAKQRAQVEGGRAMSTRGWKRRQSRGLSYREQRPGNRFDCSHSVEFNFPP